MNYKIIADESKLKEFIDWLPELQDGETYYCCLFARSKYCPELKGSDKQQLKRFTSKKEYLFDKIKQLECEVGSYVQRDIVIPQEALAMYIMPNPRSFERATKALIKTLVDKITEPYDGYNPHQEALTALQKSPARKVFMDFDFDNVSLDEIREQTFDFEMVNCDALTVVKTHGGFHLLVETEKIDEQYKKTWYQKMTKLTAIDVRGDNLLPFVGCTQGGFIPELQNYRGETL